MKKETKAVAIGLALVGTLLAVRTAKAAPLSPAEIRITDLLINPLMVNPGTRVTVTCTIANIGETTGSYKLELGGDFMANKTVVLSPGESRQVSFSVIANELGTYQVYIDKLSGTFIVTEAPVADIRLTNLVITPNPVPVGQEVTITVTATNHGEAAGTREIECLIS